MAIDDGQAVQFVARFLRPGADRLAQAYNDIAVLLDEWTTRNLGAVLPVSADLVLDEHQFDFPLTGNDVQVLIGVMAGIVGGLEANNKANLASLLKAAINPTRG